MTVKIMPMDATKTLLVPTQSSASVSESSSKSKPDLGQHHKSSAQSTDCCDTTTSSSSSLSSSSRTTAQHHEHHRHLQPQHPPARGRQVVSFGAAVVVQHIENASKDLDKKQRAARWFGTDEYTAIKSECLEDVQRVKSSDGADIYSYRGLEICDPESVVRRQRHHLDAMNAVLLVQREKRQELRRRQQVALDDDHHKHEEENQQQIDNVRWHERKITTATFPKELRKAYKKHVTESVKEALENAYIDRKAVEEYLSTTPSLSELVKMQEQQKLQHHQHRQTKSSCNGVSRHHVQKSKAKLSFLSSQS